jgi:hypothetical protein
MNLELGTYKAEVTTQLECTASHPNIEGSILMLSSSFLSSFPLPSGFLTNTLLKITCSSSSFLYPFPLSP